MKQPVGRRRGEVILHIYLSLGDTQWLGRLIGKGVVKVLTEALEEATDCTHGPSLQLIVS